MKTYLSLDKTLELNKYVPRDFTDGILYQFKIHGKMTWSHYVPALYPIVDDMNRFDAGDLIRLLPATIDHGMSENDCAKELLIKKSDIYVKGKTMYLVTYKNHLNDIGYFANESLVEALADMALKLIETGRLTFKKEENENDNISA